MTTLYIVMHCEAYGNHKRVFQGSIDSDISEKGEKQLECLAGRFKNIYLDTVYSSPLKRAVKTAEAVNRYSKREIIIDGGLVEIDGGHWEGRPWSDFPVLYPDEARDWNLAPYNFAPAGGEPMRHVFERISGAVTRIVEENKGLSIAVVSHGCAIRNLLCFLKGWPIERLNDVEWADNTAVAKVEFDDNLNPHIVYENDASHLGDGLSTFATQEWWKKENRRRLKFD